VRSPTDLPPRPRRLGRLSRRFWISAVLIVLLIGFLSLRNLAVLWTDQMWFSSVGLGGVFSTLLLVKVGLGLTFGAGEQIALTKFRTYNHAAVITVRLPF